MEINNCKSSAHFFEGTIPSSSTSFEEKNPNPIEKTTSINNQELTPEEKQEVLELKNRDREVRTHEMAHLSAAGSYAQGGAHFEYKNGPDGKQYAVGGEVVIDTSEISNDPEATIQKMKIVRKAALAPSNPSSADRAIAAKASQKESKARQEILKQKSEACTTNDEKNIKSKKNTLYTKDGLPIPSEKSSNCYNINIIV